MKMLITLFACFISFGCMAQKSDTLITYNFNGIPTKRISKATSTYKIFKKDSTTWIRITSDKNFVITKRETFSDSLLTVLNGYYLGYKNGKPFIKGIYINNNKSGAWLSYDSTGVALSSEMYLNDELNGPSVFYWPNSSIYSETNYIDNKYVGERKFFYSNGNLAIKEIYNEKSNLTDSSYFDIEGKPTSMNKLQKEPSFPGGMNKLYQFIAKGLKYPELALKERAQERVFLSFIVNELGDLEDITLTRSLNKSLGEEALRIVKTFPKWIPGTLLNKPTRTKYNININFTLSGIGY
ncbi:hypothetical protein DBR40_22900 [Pedobacter sp. KBW01]|nr:hypothetical protein DBR40_22900 [Pedobacter sp. KBW01]